MCLNVTHFLQNSALISWDRKRCWVLGSSILVTFLDEIPHVLTRGPGTVRVFR